MEPKLTSRKEATSLSRKQTLFEKLLFSGAAFLFTAMFFFTCPQNICVTDCMNYHTTTVKLSSPQTCPELSGVQFTLWATKIIYNRRYYRCAKFSSANMIECAAEVCVSIRV